MYLIVVTGQPRYGYLPSLSQQLRSAISIITSLIPPAATFLLMYWVHFLAYSPLSAAPSTLFCSIGGGESAREQAIAAAWERADTS